MTAHLDDLLAGIARTKLGIETLTTRNRDILDFHDVGVVSLKRALHRAYLAGCDATAARIFRITPKNGDTT